MRPRHLRHFCALTTCLALLSCATAPPSSEGPPPGTQPLLVRTDPAGASCSILQRGKVVASVDATPGVANVPRDFHSPILVFTKPTTDQLTTPQQVERFAPIEVVCRKDGYLERRLTFPLALGNVVRLEEEARPERSPAQQAGQAVGLGALGLGLNAAGAAAAAYPPVGLPILAGAAAGVAVAGMAAPKRPPEYAYRRLPEFFLTPEAFGSEAACDAFFASFRTKLEAARAAERARIDAHCRFWPCKPSDASCPDPVCERLRARADAYFGAELERIPALRAQAKIIGTSAGDP